MVVDKLINPRVIPILLIDGERLVKTRRFRSPVYLGDPLNVIRIFNEKEVDEIIVLDIGASLRGVGPNLTFLKELASECFIPVTYGGGISNVDDASRVFESGIEKISIQSAAFFEPKIIYELSRRYGSQAVVVSFDINKDWFGHKKLMISSRKQAVRGNWLEHLRIAAAEGAGEVLLGSIPNDGEMRGLDLGLIEEASKILDVPLIAVGGVGSFSDIVSGIKAGADAVACGSFFVFNGPHRAVLISYPEREKIDGLGEVVEHI